jgi:predicted enzyme related to lactoylglutathione lyase
MSAAKGRFCWYDLATTDPESAVKFYKDVVGWGTMDWQNPEDGETYTMWTSGETPLGGVMPLPDEAKQNGAPPHWMVYVFTPEIDATLEQAKELGASVAVPPTKIPTVGQFAVLSDPQGAMFSVFTPAPEANPMGKNGPPEPGDFSWHELATSDPDAAFKFYSELFGWVKTGDFDMGPMGTYQMYGVSEDMPLGGIFQKPDEMPMNAWLPYAMVDDATAGAERATRAGGQIINGPMEVPGGDMIAQGIDPQGAMFALHSVMKD